MGVEQSKPQKRHGKKSNAKTPGKCTCHQQQAWQWAYKNGRANIEFVAPRKCARCRTPRGSR